VIGFGSEIQTPGLCTLSQPVVNAGQRFTSLHRSGTRYPGIRNKHFDFIALAANYQGYGHYLEKFPNILFTSDNHGWQTVQYLFNIVPGFAFNMDTSI